MKETDFVKLIADRIRQRYAMAPIDCYSANALDSALFELHLLYAEATDQFNVWKKLRQAEVNDQPDWLEPFRNSYSKSPEDIQRIVDHWKQFSKALGIADC